MSFLSWEFLLLLTLGSALLFPWLARIPYSFLFLSLLPHVLIAAQWLMKRQGDVSFYFLLALLSWNVTLCNLGFFRHWLGQKTFLYYVGLFASAGLAVAMVAILPTTQILDPLSLVIPGTLSIDAVIPLTPYVTRLSVSFFAVGVTFCLVKFARIRFFSAAPAFVFLFCYWSGMCMAPMSFQTASSLQRHFADSASEGPIEAFVQTPSKQKFTAKFWAHEFHFYYQELLTRLPKSLPADLKPHFKVYFYESDDAKAKWLGARRVQIGNFMRGEMHLSELTPLSDVLPHELAHLLHGSLHTSLIAYIDPFFLEGFAVALSAPDEKNVLDEAAGLIQAQGASEITSWPRGLKFLFGLPAPVSYRLAGGFAALRLSEKRWPWDEAPGLSEWNTLKSRPVSEAVLEKAKTLLSIKPFASNPLRRDCARREWLYENSRSEEDLENLKRICPQSQRLKDSAFQFRPDYLEIFSSLSKSPDDLVRIKVEFYSSFLQEPEKSKETARNLLKRWKLPKTPENDLFKRRLEWESTFAQGM